jgi:enamine deaminase RidA (YjgF/YER057c/UK114 family)
VSREYLEPAGLGPPTDPFTHVIVVDRTVYVAGQIALDARNEIVGVGDPGLQAEQCWTNIGLALAAADCTLADIVKLTVFLKDIRHGPAETAVRRRHFGDNRMPVCTLVQVANLGFPELLMEIDVVACRGE